MQKVENVWIVEPRPRRCGGEMALVITFVTRVDYITKWMAKIGL